MHGRCCDQKLLGLHFHSRYTRRQGALTCGKNGSLLGVIHWLLTDNRQVGDIRKMALGKRRTSSVVRSTQGVSRVLFCIIWTSFAPHDAAHGNQQTSESKSHGESRPQPQVIVRVKASQPKEPPRVVTVASTNNRHGNIQAKKEKAQEYGPDKWCRPVPPTVLQGRPNVRSTTSPVVARRKGGTDNTSQRATNDAAKCGGEATARRHVVYCILD